MEMRYVKTDNRNAPVCGHALYVVLDEGNSKVTLFHPVSLVEFSIGREEYVTGMGPMLWPENETNYLVDAKKVAKVIDDRVQFFTEHKRDFPVRTVIRVQAALKGLEIRDVEKVISAKASESKVRSSGGRTVTQYTLVKKVKLSEYKGRQREILEVLSKGPATVTVISDGIKYVPKMKVQQDPTKVKEREILWVLRQVFIKQGLVKVLE